MSVLQHDYLSSASRLLRACAAGGHGVAVLCDFDGTISVRDVQVGLLDTFALPNWREAERAYLEQGYKSHTYLPAIYDGCVATEEEVRRFIDEYGEVDPHFGPFVSMCQSRGWQLEVVSDGLSIYIDRLLKGCGLSLPYYSNSAKFSGRGVEFAHPNHEPSCGKCGSCKLSRVRAARQRGAEVIIYAGDGISDECVSRHVHLLFAKDSLEAYCVREGIPHVRFRTFADVHRELAGMLQGCAPMQLGTRLATTV